MFDFLPENPDTITIILISSFIAIFGGWPVWRILDWLWKNSKLLFKDLSKMRVEVVDAYGQSASEHGAAGRLLLGRVVVDCSAGVAYLVIVATIAIIHIGHNLVDDPWTTHRYFEVGFAYFAIFLAIRRWSSAGVIMDGLRSASNKQVNPDKDDFHHDSDEEME